jgi:hypothetical protein
VSELPEDKQLLEVLKRGYTVKGWDWNYEQEYREFVFLRNCVPSGTLYFSEFRPDSLREVILGERCSLRPQFVADLIRHAKINGVGGYEPRVLLARSREDFFRSVTPNCFPRNESTSRSAGLNPQKGDVT